MTGPAGGALLVTTDQLTFHGMVDLNQVLRKKADEELLLLESADIVTKLGEKSLLFLDFALRVEAQDSKVVVTALLDEAKPLLLILANKFSDAVIETTEATLSLLLKPLYHHVDLLEKMRNRSALDVLRTIKSALVVEDDAIKKSVMLAGAFTYDFLDHFEKLPKPKQDLYHLPDFIFYLPLTVVMIDHQTLETVIYAHSLTASAEKRKIRLKQGVALIEKSLSTKTVNTFKIAKPEALKFSVDIPDADFMKLVDRCKEHIYAGDVYQIVPSRTFSHPILDVASSFQALKYLNPSPYMFFMRTSDWSLFGASPETFIKIDKGGKRISIRPIAGTRRRGFGIDGLIDHELDSREQASLCLDEKELAEHMMLVDLARNDIASVAKPKSRRIKRLLGVDRFSHVMHLVSEVEGNLAKGFDALSAYQASMNMGTLMGAPKVRAAELLRELEASKRGFYGGAVGYVDLAGDMDTAIIIRSALVKDKMAYVRTGCGVVFDSLPEFETQETINKAEAVLRAINLAGGGI